MMAGPACSPVAGHTANVHVPAADRSSGPDEWRPFVAAQGFGHLVAVGHGRDRAVVVPTQFVLQDDEVVLHLARPSPIWSAIAENPVVTLSVAGDWAFIPSAWKAVGDEDPRWGIPTTYYAAVQISGPATVIDDTDGVADILRASLTELQPAVDVVDPLEHGAKLRTIRGLRLAIEDVVAKFKFGGNVDREHRAANVDRLRRRDGPGDRAAADHVIRRSR